MDVKGPVAISVDTFYASVAEAAVRWFRAVPINVQREQNVEWELKLTD